MARIPFTYVATGLIGGIERAVPNATVTFYEADGTTLLAQSLWSLASGGSAQANPTTTGGNGATPTFWLDNAQVAVVKWTATSWTGVTETVQIGSGSSGTPAGAAGGVLSGTYPNPSLAAGAATGAALGTDVAKLVAGKLSPISQAQQVIALADLTDSSVASAASQDELAYNNASPPKLINISHKRRPQGYVGYHGDGTTDDSAVLNSMVAEIVSAGRGHIEFPNKVIACKNIELLQTNLKVDLNGATLTLPSGAVSTDDVLRSANFASITGTSNNTSSATPAAYSFTLENGTIDTGSAATGRHALALFGINYRLDNLLLISQGVGSALWEEYGGDIEDWGTGPSYRKGDSSRQVNGLVIMDNPASNPTAMMSGVHNDFSVSVSAVTNAINPTLTTARPHWLNAGQSITIASVGGATGVNGTWTVTSVTGPTTFTITTAAPGAYTSGGTVSYHISAAWTFLGPHDSYAGGKMTVIGTGSFRAGRYGLYCGDNGFGSSTGSMFNNIHTYGNFDVAISGSAGGYEFSNAQAEGSKWCQVAFKSNGGTQYMGRIFGGQGGTTLLSLRDTNGNTIRGQLAQGGQGNGPPTGFTYAATYLDTWNANECILDIRGSHDYNTPAQGAIGTQPSKSRNFILINMYGATTATTSGGWLATVAAGPPPVYGIASIPSGLTWGTN